MENVDLELQQLTYFTEGNAFTGSHTKSREKNILLRYLVRPDLKEEKLQAFCWAEDLCFDSAKNKEEKEFPLNQEGLDGVEAWLQEHYARL